MANGAKGASKPILPSANPASSTISSAHGTSGDVAVNRKKQKRRQKAAAKLAAVQVQSTPAPSFNSDPSSAAPASTKARGLSHAKTGQTAQGQIQDEEELYDSDDDDSYDALPQDHVNGHAVDASHSQNGTKKKPKKKKKNKPTSLSADQLPYPRPHGPSSAHASSASIPLSDGRDRIWNTSTQEERERIKDFWQSLSEGERKSLVKIEKDAVIKTMKDQQKHSCSCSVCGRKRTAIEEELEVLYDAYYNELEQYDFFHAGLDDPAFLAPPSKNRDQHGNRSHLDGIPPPAQAPSSRAHIQHLPEDEYDEEDYDEEEEEDDDELNEDSDEDFEYDLINSEDAESMHRVATDLFNFGNSLTVKGGILTVADDLLKNDGKKFIEMMEQLAERRMKREQQAQYSSHHPNLQYDGHDHPPGPDDEDFDEDEEEYDEDDEDYEEEEDEMDALTEDQRMAEGRRMFQLFAARLFEQRVLTAFRQRIADERQKALLEELEEEKSHDVQREAKKQRDAQKRKEKKQQQKHAKAEEKARREAEKKAEEDAAKALEAQKQEEQRKKKEEQRKKKEAERKAQEDERLKKETEKLRRQQEERERQQEVERKAREQKAQEKKARDEARRKQIEDKEAKEREAREKKASTERQRKEREEKSRAEKDTQEMAKRDAQAAAQFTNQSAQATRRTAPTVTPVAVPPLQRNPSGFSSPHVAVATPAIPKAPTPVRARPGSQQGSKGSSPKTPQVQAGLGKSNSPLDSSNQQQAALPALRKTVLPKPIQGQAQVSDANILSSVMHGIPPPGMSGPPGFGLPPLNGFQQSQAPPMRTQQAMFPNTPAQNTSQFRQQVPLSMPPAPPGMAAPGMPPIGRMFSDIPPGLQQPVPGLGATHPPPGFGPLGREMPISHAISGHARQASGSSSTFEHPIGTGPPQVVSRPAPIQRPSSVKPHEDPRFPGHDIEELSHQLGSSALLDDSDESFHNNLESRRPPAPPGLPRAGSTLSAFGPSPIFTQSSNQQRMDGFVLGSASNTASSWGTPPSSLPFGQGHISPAATWNSPTGGWPAGNPAPNPLSGLGLNPGLGSSSLGTLSRSRPVQLRTTVCALFRQMPADAYKDVGTIMRTIERVVKPPAGVEEILDILDTEGNEHNGGGTFTLQVANGNLEQSLVRWNAPADKKSVGAIGDIGSPNVMSSVPAGPPGLFPGLGAHHTAYH